MQLGTPRPATQVAGDRSLRLPPALPARRHLQALLRRVPDIAAIDRPAAGNALALQRQLRAADPRPGARDAAFDARAAQAQRLLDEARAIEGPSWPTVRLALVEQG